MPVFSQKGYGRIHPAGDSGDRNPPAGIQSKNQTVTQTGRQYMSRIFETNGEQETRALGERLGKAAEPGQIYTLIGDLGVGKTVFTQGFAKGLGIDEPISSPTFTIVQIYDEGRMPFYHLMYTVSGILRKWMKSVMRTAFTERASAS